MDELIAEGAALVARAAGVSPVLTQAIERLTPHLIDYARKAIERGADPESELVLLMAGAEEAARAQEKAKFGG